MTEKSGHTDERTKLKHPYGEMWASFAPTGSFVILVILLDFQYLALLATAYALMNNADEIRQLLEWKGRITLSAEDEFLWLRLTVFGGIPPLFLVLRWLVPNEWLMHPYFLWSLIPIWLIGPILQWTRIIAKGRAGTRGSANESLS